MEAGRGRGLRTLEARPPRPAQGSGGRGWHVSAAGRGGTRARAAAFPVGGLYGAPRVPGGRWWWWCGGGGGGGGSRGIRKSTSCRVCTRAGKGLGDLVRPLLVRPPLPSCRGARLRPGTGTPPAEGLRLSLSSLIACGPERARSGGTCVPSNPSVTPSLFVLTLDPWYSPSPGVFLRQGLSAPPSAPFLVSLVNPLPQYPPLSKCSLAPVPVSYEK